MSMPSAFIAYPSIPAEIGDTIQRAAKAKTLQSHFSRIQPWIQNDIPGEFIRDSILSSINDNSVLVGDITTPNFNVTYEIGYAIGRDKRICLIKNTAFSEADALIQKIGIYDTIRYHPYSDSSGLIDILSRSEDATTLAIPHTLNYEQPVYIVIPELKNDFIQRIIARLKKIARLQFTSFDPTEHSRMSAFDAIRGVKQSLGVVLYLLPKSHREHFIHNLRSAFVAGLAHALEKEVLILQSSDDPVPLDYRDLVRICRHPKDIDDHIAALAPHITEALQARNAPMLARTKTCLENLNLGASAAENEMRNLGEYFVETDAYRRALRGEVRLAVGRKGSGKTALFFQVRDHHRRNKRNVVLDLKPEGYQLLQFKEIVLALMQEGAVTHLFSALWEYLLYLEICYKLLEKDQSLHLRDNRLFEPYRRLSELYQTDEYLKEADFSERTSKLLDRVATQYASQYGNGQKISVTTPTTIEILYHHDIKRLRNEVLRYLHFKDSLWILFDNIDKGWPAHGLQSTDLIIIRTLLEATRKIQRELQRHDTLCHTLVVLRNDIFELLLDSTPDRGKEQHVTVDWKSADYLRELLKRRFVFCGLSKDADFISLWRQLFVSHVKGRESSDYIISRSLMRPRCLLDIIEQCKGNAINMGRDKISEEDIETALSNYSCDVLYEIDRELRDVLPQAENVLYTLIGCQPQITKLELKALIGELNVGSVFEDILDLLLWFGVLGVVDSGEEARYIFHFNYDSRLLKATINKLDKGGAVFEINPAFWPALSVVEQ